MPNGVEERQTVVLAAFLHDIGKLLGRGSFQVLDKGQHPKYSADFISAHRDVFSTISDVDLLHELVQKHHESRGFPPELRVDSITDEHSRTLARLVSKADNLSSAERGESADERQYYKTTPMASVLARINKQNDDGLSLRFHPEPLTATGDLGSIFPETFTEYKQGEMNNLITGFGSSFTNYFVSPENNAKPVNRDDFDTLLTHLVNLVHQYCWCVPSNTREEVPDVSLFDHLKTTAAIASCLYRYHYETDTLIEASLVKPASPRFCLVAGDLSGIQSYIFDIASIGTGGVARRLRARSLFVQLCTEVTAHLILEKLNLSQVNNIMGSGGKFYLLLPNLAETTRVIEEVQGYVDKWFLEELNGELALNLAYTTFDEEGFKTGIGKTGFGTVMQKTARQLDKRKQNRFVARLQEQERGKWNENSFVLPVSFTGESACISCRKFPVERDKLCIHCLKDREAGARLPGTRYLAFYHDSDYGDLHNAMPVLGRYVVGTGNTQGIKGSPYLVLKLNDTDLSELTGYAAATKYLASHIAKVADCQSVSPADTGEQGEPQSVATFAILASSADGKEMLAYLKVDVDRLGELFAYGLKRENKSIDTVSRLATMSRQLDLFFSGWIEHLTSTQFPCCYTVFSGGDDLLIIGPWDAILKLADRINSDFARYADNASATLSAGVLFAKPGFPVARAVSTVDELLEQAKGKDVPGEDTQYGNRIGLPGSNLTWQEWMRIRKDVDRLKPYFGGSGRVPSAFLQNLLLFSDMWQKYRKGDVLGLRFQPLLAYSTTRNLDKGKFPAVYEWTEKLLKWPPDNEQCFVLDNLGLIARLLILYSQEGGRVK